MEIQGRHINTHPRRDGGPKPAKLYSSIKKKGSDIVIRIDDSANPEFWMQVSLTQEEMNRVLNGEMVTVAEKDA